MTKALKPIIGFGDATPEDVSDGITFTSENGISVVGTGRVEWICNKDGTEMIPAFELGVDIPDLTAKPNDIAASKVAYCKDGFITGTAEYITVVFYDWDNIFLGSIAVEKHSSAEALNAALRSFAKSKCSPAVPVSFPDTFPSDLTQEFYVDDAAYPLTCKKGYNFAGWIQVDGGEGTESLTDAFTAYKTIDEFKTSAWDYAAGLPEGKEAWGNLVLKAGYVENGTCNADKEGTRDDLADSYANQTFTGSYSFNRYGAASNTAGNYAISVRLKRENEFGNGTVKLKEPALLTEMYAEGSSAPLFSLVYLQGSDILTGEIVPTKGISYARTRLIDVSQYQDYLKANYRSATLTFERDEGKGDIATENLGYLIKGTVGLINRLGIAAYKEKQATGLTTGSAYLEWTSSVNNITLNDASLGRTFNVGTANTIGRTRLMAQYESNGGMELSHKQMVELMK